MPRRRLEFLVNGQGTLTVIAQRSADDWAVAENAATQPNARTMALDPKTHRVFLPAAQFESASAPAGGAPPRRTIKAGSFNVLPRAVMRDVRRAQFSHGLHIG